jgi:hypothetical protein
MISIKNICPDFFLFWEQARHCTLSEQKELWVNIYEDNHRDIFDLYYAHWGDPAMLEDALKKFPRTVPVLQQVTQNVEERIRAISKKCADIFETTEDVAFVTLVGVFCSNGWTTTFRHGLTSFLALECFTNPHHLDILIAHETAHSLHIQYAPPYWTSFTIGGEVFREGLAIVASEMVCPGAAAEEYLWFSTGFSDWIGECEHRWEEIAQRLLQDLTRVDMDLFKVYFGMRRPETDLPQRTAPIFGYRIVSILQNEYTITEMASWAPERAVTEVKQALEKMVQRGNIIED